MTIEEQYFKWLCDKIVDGSGSHKYSKLLTALYSTEFVPTLFRDDNRAADGIHLRYIFADEKIHHYSEVVYYLDRRNCSIFEMMVALSMKCEDIMDDDWQDRTPLWFWDMVRSLGLIGMTDEVYSASMVDEVLETFNNRKYEKNGTGGLFTIPWYDGDVRNVEIWYQMHLYLKDKN